MGCCGPEGAPCFPVGPAPSPGARPGQALLSRQCVTLSQEVRLLQLGDDRACFVKLAARQVKRTSGKNPEGAPQPQAQQHAVNSGKVPICLLVVEVG